MAAKLLDDAGSWRRPLYKQDSLTANRVAQLKARHGGKMEAPKVESSIAKLFACSNERRVLVIYTGGTIGMVKNDNGALEPKPNAFEPLVRSFSQLNDPSYVRENHAADPSLLALPVVNGVDSRLVYKIYEYEHLLDSSNMTFAEWIRIAKDVKRFYSIYDGFVILHGTDTLSYTASALSFMLENLGKCVLITGSQIPMFETRTDGVDNFVSSLIIAGTFNIPEVTVFFNSKLFRGNRTVKYSSNELAAFISPNFEPLVEVGIDMEIRERSIFRPKSIEEFHVHADMCENVGVLRMFPSIGVAVLKAFFQPPIEGVVLETYGSGNMPSNRQDLIDVLKEAVNRGVIILNITQCSNGSVAEIYETGKFMSGLGVVAGYDLTPEAALTKLAYVLSKKEWSRNTKIQMLTSNLRGEMTLPYTVSCENSALRDALANSLHLSSAKQLDEVTKRVLAALLEYAIENGDLKSIKEIEGMGADLNIQNCEGKTPLHETIILGNVAIVDYLLRHGANVHTKTRFGESPLMTAIERDEHEIIELLRRCGAHLTNVDPQEIELMSLATRQGNMKRLHSLKIAGADFNMTDQFKQSALHKAVMVQNIEAVKFLLEEGVNTDVEDFIGMTPKDYANRLHLCEIEKLL